MDPRVGGVFLALDHRRRGVISPWVLVLRVAVQNAGPDERAAAFWLDLDVEVGEDGLAAFFNVGEIQEEGENARAAGEKFLATGVMKGMYIVEK